MAVRHRLSPILRRIAAAAFLAILPGGCVGAADAEGLAPALAAAPTEGLAVSAGQSALGAYLAARWAHASHEIGAAADFYSRALAADPENVELLQRAHLLLAAEGRLDEAVTLARRLLSFDSEAAVAAMLVASRDVKEGRLTAAEDRLAKLPRRGINSFMAPMMLAWTRAAQGRFDPALAALAPMAGTSPLAPLHDFHAALINDLADRRAAAEKLYDSLVTGEATPLTLRAVEAAGAFYQRVGRIEKARALYARYRGQHPGSGLLDGDSLLAQGGKLPRIVTSGQEGLAEAMFGAATSIRQGNALDVALVFGRLALDLRPNFPLAQVLVADILQSQERFDQANEIYRAIDPASPAWWSAQLRVAENLEDSGRADQAATLLRDMAGQRPERWDALVSLGDVLRRGKKFADAAESYGQAITRVPRIERHHWTLFYSRGIALERSQRWPEAETDFLKALELERDQPYVLNYLGYTWVERGINLDQARKMIEKAASLRPDDGAIIDSLGWVLYRLGDYPEAVRNLERAVELRPEDPTINDHLGDALWRVGRRDEARFQWQRALLLETDAEAKQGLEAKLKAGRPLAATDGGT
ncbi:MAG: tetratricopeptide repeat protein [Alphaproteobacteria bacterium]|nr:tetratricopeptide repeat protein [Alphaproteobacteria bacterium]